MEPVERCPAIACDHEASRAMTGQWWWSNLSHETPSIAIVHAVGKEGLTHRQTLNSGQLKKKVTCISRSEGGRAAHEEGGKKWKNGKKKKRKNEKSEKNEKMKHNENEKMKK